MYKLSEEGKPLIYNELGKVMKGPNYSPPNLKKLSKLNLRPYQETL